MTLSERIIKWISLILSLVLACFLGYKLYETRQENSRQAELAEMREQEALPYRVELEQAKKELRELSRKSYVSAEAELMVGFVIVDPSDLDYIKEKADKYRFSPILIFDCAGNIEALADIVAAAEPSWEIMLYTSSASGNIAEKIEKSRAALASHGREDCGLFFLRRDFFNDKISAELTGQGMKGYTVYHDEPQSGQESSGNVYFDYSYIRNPEVDISRRLLGCYNSKASMLFALDMSAIRAGTIPEAVISRILSTLDGYVGKNDCRFATAGEVKSELSDILRVEAEYAQTAEEESKRLSRRIAELEAILGEIYGEIYDE